MMRLSIMLAVIVPSTAYGLNIKPTTRADHKSLDVVVRRLEDIKDPPQDVVACLQHLRPMLTRHGGPIGWGRVEIGSEDEIDLVCAQHGYARTSVERGDIAEDLAIGFFRWLRNAAWAIIVGLGPVTVVLIIVAYLYIQSRRTIHEYDRGIEQSPIDKEERRRLFSHPLIQRAHAKIKKAVR